MDDQAVNPIQPIKDETSPQPSTEESEQAVEASTETPTEAPEIPNETQEPEPKPTPVDPSPSTEPVVQPADPEPIPEQPAVPEPAPKTDSSETPNVVIPTPIEVNPAPRPVPSEISDPSGIPAAVLALTPEELKIAARLYITRNQKEISAKGVAKRKATMQANLDKIIAFLTTHGSSPLPRIAKAINVSPGTTSSYLRRLRSTGKIKATGHGVTRRYSL